MSWIAVAFFIIFFSNYRINAAIGFVHLPVGSQRRRSGVLLALYSLLAGGPQAQPRCIRSRPTRRPIGERASSLAAPGYCRWTPSPTISVASLKIVFMRDPCFH
jgi:hypothetical protein